MSANIAETSKKYKEDAEKFYQRVHAQLVRAKKDAEFWESALEVVAKTGQKLTKIPFTDVVKCFEKWLNARPAGEANHNTPEYQEYLRLQEVGKKLEAEVAIRREGEPVTQQNPRTLLLSGVPRQAKSDKPEGSRVPRDEPEAQEPPRAKSSFISKSWF